MRNYYDGRTPHEDYPIDIGPECFNCKYRFDCFSDANHDKTKTRCLIERVELVSDMNVSRKREEAQDDGRD